VRGVPEEGEGAASERRGQEGRSKTSKGNASRKDWSSSKEKGGQHGKKKGGLFEGTKKSMMNEEVESLKRGT